MSGNAPVESPGAAPPLPAGAPPAEASPPPEPPPRRGFRARVLGGAFWTMGGYGLAQVLRFASNLILTRLLLPEAFGLMALVTVFVTGLEMLSDMGLGAAIVQGKRGDDPAFLRTAWTLQVVRGAVLALIAAAIAWPLARFYAQPQITWLLPALAGTCVLRGFASIRLHTVQRKVLLARLTMLELGAQVVGIAVTVVAAWLFHSVWALVIGNLFGVVATVIFSHLLLPGPRDGFLWDRQAARDLAHVARWVVVSTATTFLVAHLDRLTMGRLLSAAHLGIYSMALFLSTAVPLLGRALSARVFFPLLSETARESPGLIYKRLRKMRLMWTIPICAALVLLSLTAELLVKLIYPPRFHEAGWMLRLLAAGCIPAVLNDSGGVVWPTLGKFRTISVLMGIQMCVLMLNMFVGNALGGTAGVVAGVALVQLMIYPVQAAFLARLHLWQPEVDLPILAVCLTLLGLTLVL